jgi:hypothetical protein
LIAIVWLQFLFKTMHYGANHVQSYHGVVTKIKNSADGDRLTIFRALFAGVLGNLEGGDRLIHFDNVRISNP